MLPLKKCPKKVASTLAISLLLNGPKASPDVGGFEIRSSFYRVSSPQNLKEKSQIGMTVLWVRSKCV